MPHFRSNKGGGGQKSLKICLRNISMVPKADEREVGWQDDARTTKTQFLHCHHVSGHFWPHCPSRGRVSSKYSILLTKSKKNCMFLAIL